MPNPYDDIFEAYDDEDKKPQHSFNPDEYEEEQSDNKDALDEILERIGQFNQLAESFSKLLSKTRAIEHKVDKPITRFFLAVEDKYHQDSLAEERQYHQLLMTKFERLIVPMHELAKSHLQTIQQFNRDIDKDYYSVEKTDRTVQSDKSTAIEGITLQRKILADGSNNLTILKDALERAEARIKDYVDTGGEDHISKAEFEMIVQKGNQLTSGRQHQFDYSFFSVNLLDKTAISLGIYMKETTAQYLSKLRYAFGED